MRNLGPTEIILILLVVVLLFGAKKLPELARGSGRALRIFKAETKGLIDDDDDEEATRTDTRTDAQRRIDELHRLEAGPVDPAAPAREPGTPAYRPGTPSDTDR